MKKIIILILGLFFISHTYGQISNPKEKPNIADTIILQNQFSDYVNWLKTHPQDTTKNKTWEKNGKLNLIRRKKN